MPKPTPLTPDQRAELVKRIRFELGLQLGRNITLTEFGEMVGQLLGLAKPFSPTAAMGWERGAEPGFLAGCAIAHLGGLPAEALAFKQAKESAESREGGLAWGQLPPLKGVPIRPAKSGAKKKGKSA